MLQPLAGGDSGARERRRSEALPASQLCPVPLRRRPSRRAGPGRAAAGQRHSLGRGSAALTAVPAGGQPGHLFLCPALTCPRGGGAERQAAGDASRCPWRRRPRPPSRRPPSLPRSPRPVPAGRTCRRARSERPSARPRQRDRHSGTIAAAAAAAGGAAGRTPEPGPARGGSARDRTNLPRTRGAAGAGPSRAGGGAASRAGPGARIRS